MDWKRVFRLSSAQRAGRSRCEEFGQLRNQVRRTPSPTLPNGEHVPPRVSQCASIPLIPPARLSALVSPESPVLGGFYPAVPAPVHVPKVTVHEDNLLSAVKDDVRFARKINAMQFVLYLQCVKQRTYGDLRLGVLPFDGRHAPAALLGSECLHGLCHMQWQAPEARQLLAQRVSAGYRVYKDGKHRRRDTCLTPTLKT
jgi:hypothetical protein